MRFAHLADHRRHVGIGLDRIGQHGDEPELVALDAPVAHLEIEPRQELAVAARGDKQGVADLDRRGQRVVRVAGQDHVDALHPAGQLAVDVEAVVAQQHDQIDLVGAQLLDIGRDLLFLDAERPVGDQVARVGDRRVGKRLADHADAQAATLEHSGGLKHRVAPGCLLHVAGEEGNFSSLTSSSTRLAP